MQDIFGKIPAVKLSDITCHTGGAIGSDKLFEAHTMKVKGSVKAYSYKTEYHKSPNKVEISEEDYDEGVHEINRANHILNRWNVSKFMNLLARNWAQVKYSGETFAIGNIIEPNKRGNKYYNRSKLQEVDGGTGYCVKMSILHGRPVYVFDQNVNNWFRWSYVTDKYIICQETPVISNLNFAGVGTRNINKNGIRAIEELYQRTELKYSSSFTDPF